MSTDLASEKTGTGIGEDRRSFVARITIEVMKDRLDVIKTIHEWAIVVLDHYQQRRERYIEEEKTIHPQSRIFKHGDGWLTSTYIENSFSSIREYAVEMGHWISDEDFTGVTLATDTEQIESDHKKKAKRLKAQGDKQSYKALRMNKHKPGLDLGVITTTYLPAGDDVS